MKEIRCADLSCGVMFGIPDHIYDQAVQNPTREMICPNGHVSVYRTSEADRLREKLSGLERTIQGLRDDNARSEASRSKLVKTVSYWRGIAHRKRRPPPRG